jgi:hypothetical protein
LAIAAHMGIEFNRSHPYFWETLPAPEDNLDLALMSDEELLLLQDEVMIAQGQEHRRLNEAIYYGENAVALGRLCSARSSICSGENSKFTTKFIHFICLSRSFNVQEVQRSMDTPIRPCRPCCVLMK